MKRYWRDKSAAVKCTMFWPHPNVVNGWLYLTKVKIRSAITSARPFYLMSKSSRKVKVMCDFSSIPAAFKKNILVKYQAIQHHCKPKFFHLLDLPFGWVYYLLFLHHTSPSSPVCWSLICVSRRGCNSSVLISCWLPSVPVASQVKRHLSGGLT